MGKPRDHRRIGLLFVESSLGLFLASAFIVAVTQSYGAFSALQGILLFSVGLLATGPLLKFYLSGQVRFAALYAVCAGLGLAACDFFVPATTAPRALWIDLGYCAGLLLGATFFLFFVLRAPLLRLLTQPQPELEPARVRISS